MRAPILILIALSTLRGPASAAEGPRKIVTLEDGQSATVPGTDLSISVKDVRDLSGRGCLGGPVGCPDSARLEVSRGAESRTITLHVRAAPLERRAAREAAVLGYRLTLTALKGKQITLAVEPEPPASPTR